MTHKIEIHSKGDWTSNVEMKDNSDFMYFLSTLKVGSRVKVAIDEPELFCKIEIFETEKEVFD